MLGLPLFAVLPLHSVAMTVGTITCPIWVVKIRMQLGGLDSEHGARSSVRECVREIYTKHGWKGFYKGLTASYLGMSTRHAQTH